MDTAVFEIKLRINSNIASTANFTSTRTSWTVICVCSLNSLGKHTGVGCHSLLQGTFPIQGPASPVLQADSLPSEPLIVYGE